MFLKKKVACIVLATLPLLANANSFTAKSAARGFTGVTGDFTSALYNPALLIKFDQDDDAYLSFNLGIIGSDQDDLIERGEQVADNIDQLINDINNEVATENQVNSVLDEVASIDGILAFLREGINLQAIFPNSTLSWGLFVNQSGKGGATINYEESDGILIRDAFGNAKTILAIKNNTINISDPEVQADISHLLTSLNLEQFDVTDLENIDLAALEDAIRDITISQEDTLLDPDDLLSQGLALGYSVSEAGINFATQLVHHANYDLSLGGALKYQRFDIIDYRVRIVDFDGDSFDANEFSNDIGHFNADLGAHINWGDERQWQAGLVIRNLSPKSLPSINGVEFNLDPSVTVGIAYDSELFSVSVDWDVTERENFQRLKSVQYFGIGVEFDLWQHGQLRAGIRTDLNDIEDDLYTIGFGLSPWDVVAFDVALLSGSRDALGVALQLSFKI
jgi:hypothetical protein